MECFRDKSMSINTSPCVFLLEYDQSIAQIINNLCSRANLMLCHFQSWDLLESQLHTQTPCCLIISTTQDDSDTKARISHITDTHNHLPVIVLGQSQNLTEAVASIKAGAIDYIEKPVITGRLAQHIANL